MARQPVRVASFNNLKTVTTLVIKPVIHLRVFPRLNLMRQISIIYILNTTIMVQLLHSGATKRMRLDLNWSIKKYWVGAALSAPNLLGQA